MTKRAMPIVRNLTPKHSLFRHTLAQRISHYISCLLCLLGLLLPIQAAHAADFELLHSYPADFTAIAGLAFDSQGKLYVLAGGKAALLQRTEGEQLVSVLDKVDINTGKAANLFGFTLLDDNSFAFIDASSAAVRLMNIDGKLIADFGEKGTKAGMLKKPVNLAYSINKRLYIADPTAGRVAAYNRNGVFLSALGQASADAKQNLKMPEFVAVDALERVYVLKAGTTPTLSVFSGTGEMIKHLTELQLKPALGGKPKLTAMTVDKAGRLFLADSAAGKILQFDWENLKVVQSFGSKGKGPGQYLDAVAIALGPDNQIAVADARNKKIDVYNLGGEQPPEPQRAWLPNVGRAEFLAAACSQAYRLADLDILCLDKKANQVSILSPEGKPLKTLSASFKAPSQAAFDAEHIVVLNKSTIMVFRTDGTLLSEFGSSGSAEGKLSRPEDIFLRGNRIYVAESGSKRVQVFSLKGVYLDKIPASYDKENPVLVKPVAVAVDFNGNIYVADDTKKSIQVFGANREPLYHLGEPPTNPGGFKTISDLAVDTDNNIYVLCQTGLKEQTVQVYSGPERIFEFGAFSKKTPTGIGKGTSVSVSPTAKTLVDVFDVVDVKNPGFITFNYLQVPAPATELAIAGGIKATQLNWRSPPGSYIDKFKVYGAADKAGPYELIDTIRETHLTITDTKDVAYRFFKVSAVSGFGTEGPKSSSRENQFQKAYQRFQTEAFAEAVEILQADLNNNPQQAEANKLLGQSFMQLQQYPQAAAAFARFSEFEGNYVEGLNLQIDALYTNKDYAEAMALVRTVVEKANDNIASYINCGRLSLKIDDAVGAFVCLEDGAKLDPNNAEINFLLAEAYIQLDTIDQGIEQLEKAVAIAPANIDYRVRSGEVYRKLNKLEQAKQQYEQAIALDASHTAAQLGLAQIYVALDDMANAKNIALKLAAKPDSAGTGNYLLGLIELKNEQNGKAVLAFSKATRAEPDNTDAWLALADTYEKMGKKDQVKTSLRGAVQADPASFPALKRLSLVLRDSGDYAEAADVLMQAIALRDNDYDVILSAAEVLFNSKQYNQAAEYARRAVQLLPEDATTQEADKKDTRSFVLAANIAKQRGKTGEAIEFLKSAMAIEKGDYALYVQLGELYLENNLYDQAETILNQAIVINKTDDRAFVLQGNLYMARRVFDKAIAAYEQASKLNGSADNRLLLDTAYAEKKRSLEFSSNAPQLVLEDLRLDPVFSAAYKQYADKPVGSIKVKNVSGTEYGNLQVSFEIKGYMDFPNTQTIAVLAPNSQREIPLLAALNNKVLEIDEDTGVQVEVKLNYLREGRSDSISVTQPMTLYGKNAIVWGNPNMVGSFVTPKDDTLRDYVRLTINAHKPEPGALNENLVTAMTLFNALSAQGLRYQVDPNNPFTALKSDQVDYVQFARETLRLKSGDCDDLSVLFSASLENIGVPTAILDVPGHLLMMFDTGVPVEDRNLISAQDDLLVLHNDTIWVPLEVTMIATSFAEAWAEGANKYYVNKQKDSLKIIPLQSAWQEFQPVTLKPASYEIKLAAEEKVKPLIQREQKILLEKSLDRLVGPYRAIAQNNPKDELARMQIAIIYGKYGLYDNATYELDEILKLNPNNGAVYNNRGNIFLSKGDLDSALDAYSQAERLDPSDGGIKLNLAILSYSQGDVSIARTKFKQATKLNKTIAKDYATFGKLLKN